MPDEPDEPDETQAMPPRRPPAGAAATGWLLADRYRVVGRIGSGGMAEVFRAHDESLDRDVALKIFRSDVGEPGDAANAGRQSLELQSLARLNHPNLITLYDGSMTGPGPSYLVMELVPGSDLAVRLEQGPLPPDQVRTLGAQMGDALAYVHSQGIAHRDVKPANILLGDDGRARLSDFGIVRLIGSPRMTSPDLTVGTASYVAPEQARGGDVGAPADVYSLGLVLIESLTGQRCFDGPMLEAMAARLSRAPHIPPELPAPWPQLLAAMTAMDPAARPTAAQVAQILSSGSTQGLTAIVPPAAGLTSATTAYVPPLATAGGTRAMPAVPPPPPVRRPPPVVYAPPPEPEHSSPWRAVLFTLAGLLLLAVIGVVIYALSSGSGDGGGGSDSPAPTTSTSGASSSHSSSSSHSQPATRTHTHTHTKTVPASKPPKKSSSSKSKPSAPPSSKSTSKSSSSSSSSPPPTKTKTKGNGNGNAVGGSPATGRTSNAAG